MAGTLGRKVPTDWKHYEKFPLTAATTPSVPTPAVIGVNWYTDFDQPVRDAKQPWVYWIGRDARRLGSVRGGHCVCLHPHGMDDLTAWWDFYNQGAEGACVGFGSSRMMSLLNRKRYWARWLWDWAKATDEYGSETNPGDDEGTSVRAAMEILRTRGHVPWQTRYQAIDDQGAWQQRDRFQPSSAEGISAYRWARTAQEVLDVVGHPLGDFVEIVNSWGRDYPHYVRMPAETLQRIIDEDGEAALVTDR